MTDRFYALWVLEATSGMRRCELAGAERGKLDLDQGTLAIDTTRVVVNGKVIESDGKTENAQRVIALDPFTLAALRVLVDQLDSERAEFGPDYQDHGLLFCYADVAFTMRQYVKSDLDADREVATALAELIIGGVLASVPVSSAVAQDGRDDAT